MINTIKKILLLLPLALLFVTPVFPVLANTHTVTPLVINLNLEKRDIVNEHITLTNNSSRVVRVYASVNSVAMDGDGVVESFVQKSMADRTNTPTTWIEISRQRIQLAPGEVKEVPFIVRMNPNTKPGIYNVFIGFAEGANRPIAESKVAQGTAPGTIVTIAVDQTQDKFIRLEQFVVDTFVTDLSKGTYSYTLANPSKVDIAPEGEIIFYTPSGEEVASQKLNTEKISIAPDSEYIFTNPLPDTLTIGKYKAFLSVEYGDYLTASVQDTDYFYVLPLKILLLIFFGVLLFSALFVLLIYYKFQQTTRDNAHGAKMVPLYLKEGISQDYHHDIDLSKKNEK